MQQSSRFVITIDPGVERIDPKIALETGMAVLLNKPILVLVPQGVEPTPGLLRVATQVLRLTAPITSFEAQVELASALELMNASLE
jgi:hypothetical protein